MGKSDILEQLFDEKILKIIRIFYQDTSQQFYLREISKKTNVPVASTHRILKRLAELNIIAQLPIKKFKIYKLGDNEATRFLGQIIKKERQALQVFITRAKAIPGIESIILQGKEEIDRANIIIIGHDINKEEVKKICASIRDEFNFTITELVLEREQFEQMNKMGLYPGKKKVIYPE